jgi:selenocysteine lyase/cysteine desulfurase
VLTDRLVDGVRSRGYEVLGDRSRAEVRSGIVTFRRDDVDPVALGKRLGQAGICVTCRPNGIRVSPHGHNTSADIEALLDALP